MSSESPTWAQSSANPLNGKGTSLGPHAAHVSGRTARNRLDKSGGMVFMYFYFLLALKAHRILLLLFPVVEMKLGCLSGVYGKQIKQVQARQGSSRSEGDRAMVVSSQG